MAARNCPECNGLVSSTINVCPHCGYSFTATSTHTDSRRETLPGRNPHTSLLYPILALIFAWPFAIASFIYYFKSDEAWSNGDKKTAESYAQSSRTWGIIPVYLVLLLMIVWFIFIIAVL